MRTVKEQQKYIMNRKRRLKYRYGLTLKQYEKMLEKQECVCAICGLPEICIYKGETKPLSVDHDHKTGKIRGLLCVQCNRDLSVIENEKFVGEANMYLKRWDIK